MVRPGAAPAATRVPSALSVAGTVGSTGACRDTPLVVFSVTVPLSTVAPSMEVNEWPFDVNGI